MNAKADNKTLLCLFLNLDIGNTLTGIETSAILRSKLFIEYLNINPTLITIRYNPNLQGNILSLIDSGKAHKEINVINLYDIIQGFDEVKESISPANNPIKNLTFKNVSKTIDIKYFDKFDNLIMYKVHNKKTDKLSHINYFNNKKIYKRDKFNFNGLLSSSQFIDTNTKQIDNEIFFNSIGKPVIIKYFNYVDNQNKLYQIHILNDTGSVEEILFSEDEFVNYSLSTFIEKTQKDNILIISDKSKYTFMPSVYLKEKFPNIAITLIPVIHSTHTKSLTDIKEGQIKSHYKDIFENLSKTDKLAVLSDFQKDDIFSRFTSSNIDVIPHTYIKIDDNIKYNPTRGKVIYIARYSPEKNHDSAIKIFSMVLKEVPWATLHCYGDGSEKERLQSIINDLKLQNSIFLHEYASNVEELYASAELNIMTSKMEGFPLSLLESIAIGCPVIAYDVRYGPSDIILNDFLVPFGDEETFSKKIINVLTNSKLQKKISKNSKLQFEKKFSPNVVAKIWNNVIQSLQY